MPESDYNTVFRFILEVKIPASQKVNKIYLIREKLANI